MPLGPCGLFNAILNASLNSFSIVYTGLLLGNELKSPISIIGPEKLFRSLIFCRINSEDFSPGYFSHVIKVCVKDPDTVFTLFMFKQAVGTYSL